MTEITQADRDAADEIMEQVDACGCKLCGMRVYEAFARHRMEERAAIVEWLRKVGGSGPEVLADMIDAGGYLE